MTMTKKRLLLIASVPLAIVAVTLGVLAMLPPRPGVTKANFDRIEKGMTKAQVEEILGEKGFLVKVKKGDAPCLYWNAGDGAEVWIRFSDDCVNGDMTWSADETFLDKIRSWLHLR
jgi:hypothetical protein